MTPTARTFALTLGLSLAACTRAPAPTVDAPTTTPEPVAADADADATEPPAPDELAQRRVELRSRASTEYRAGNYRACANTYAELAELVEPSAGEAYDRACCLARLGGDDDAFTWLEHAAKRGLRNLEHVRQDGDLLTLHEHPRWAAFEAAVQSNLDDYLASINRELYEIYQVDQLDRQTPEIDWSVVGERDRARQKRVLEIVDAGQLHAADDWFHAAMVMQHGSSLDDYDRAHRWALKAVELDPEHRLAKWMAAAAKDRWLMNQGKPQQYGTQYVMEGDRWVLYEVDPATTDAERARWEVPPLAEAQRRAEAMNQQ